MSGEIIYDFGANNGDDIPYYLMKAEKTIAVEANPVLALQIARRFPGEIAGGRLVVENCVLTVDSTSALVPFFIHKTNDVLSQFPSPPPGERSQFEEVALPSKNVIELIRKYGTPKYVKIDIEHYDQTVLRHLFLNDIRPPYISAESHSIDIFCLMVSLGHYNAFKLVDGATISKAYANHRIETLQGVAIYSFPHHSAGPFGNDISGGWQTKEIFFKALGQAGLGWRDIHASNVESDIDSAKRRSSRSSKNWFLSLGRS